MIVCPYETCGTRHRITEIRPGQSKLIIPHRARHNNEGEVVRSKCGKTSTRHWGCLSHKLVGSVGSGRCWFVYQIHPPTIDTLLTGMPQGTVKVWSWGSCLFHGWREVQQRVPSEGVANPTWIFWNVQLWPPIALFVLYASRHFWILRNLVHPPTHM